MKFTGMIVTAYGLIVALGGLVGYLTAESLASLIAGSLFGALLFASGLGLCRSSIVAYFTGTILSLSLTVFFSIRYYHTQKMMPGGMMAIISALIFLMLLTAKGRPKKKPQTPS